MHRFRAEFHIHTVLSPCASVEMIPPLIIQEALQKKIDIIAITDHNSTANNLAVIEAAQGTTITVLPGIELQTREDIHILGLFPDIEKSNDFQSRLNPYLPTTLNQPEIFGPQYVVDSTGEFIRHETHMLSQAVNLTIDQAWQIVHECCGLFVPAHINRKMFGILPTLGFLPENIPFDALEITSFDHIDHLRLQHPTIKGFPLLRDGDAHHLNDILGLNEMLLREPTFEEIKLAIEDKNGRRLLPHRNR